MAGSETLSAFDDLFMSHQPTRCLGLVQYGPAAKGEKAIAAREGAAVTLPHPASARAIEEEKSDANLAK